MEQLTLLDTHLSGLAAALLPYRSEAAGRLARWGAQLAWHLGSGGRLLVAGNGGSAAEAQHLAAELVGKLREDRAPLSAIALTPDSSAITAIGNDYGFEEVFARQVRAHGRPDDVLLVLSTSGRSPNLLAAVHAARECGVRTWAMVGPGRSPLGDACDEALRCPAADSQVVQELHLISVHVMCEYVDRTLPAVLAATAPAGPAPAAGAPVTATAPNGLGTNGHGPNGLGTNGHGPNGRGANGHGANGHGANGHADGFVHLGGAGGRP